MATIQELLAGIRERHPTPESMRPLLSGLFRYLEEAEERLLHALDLGEGLADLAPNLSPDGQGLEFSLVLHRFQHRREEVFAHIEETEDTRWLYERLVEIMPESRILPDHFSALHAGLLTHHLVLKDGTIIGFRKYEALDHHWLGAFWNYLLNLLPWNPLAPFGDTPYHGPLLANDKAEVTIAIIGDWGTGYYDDHGNPSAAQNVYERLNTLDPDYIIHLGDVYYSGTADNRHPPNEERDNLLHPWGKTPPKTSFTLNSNHEMYGAADGYFGVATAKNTPFSHQLSTSYFALEFGNWVLLGLDSAYYSGSLLYMNGALGQPDHTEQAKFIRKLREEGKLAGKKIIILTHHNGLEYDGTWGSSRSLWRDVAMALGRNPDYWYWGHVHLGAVYKPAALSGLDGTTKARCIGHSAIPYGDPWGLAAAGATVEWYEHDGRPTGHRRVRNGFALLTLSKTDMSEAIYQEGTDQPVWPAGP